MVSCQKFHLRSDNSWQTRSIKCSTLKKHDDHSCFEHVAGVTIRSASRRLRKRVIRGKFVGYYSTIVLNDVCVLQRTILESTDTYRVSQFSLRRKRFYFETMLKDQLFKTSGWHYHKGLFGLEKVSKLSRNGPLIL